MAVKKKIQENLKEKLQKKSQVSVEAMVAVAVIFIFFTITSIFFYQKNYEATRTRAYLDGLQTCSRLSDIITDVYANGEGADMIFYLSYENTTINSTARAIVIEHENVVAACKFPHSSITNISATTFTLQKGYVRLRNVNQTVVMANI